VLDEGRRLHYDRMVVGASDAWLRHRRLFGALSDGLAECIDGPLLLARRYESAVISWIRRQARVIPVLGSQPEPVPEGEQLPAQPKGHA
jgi:hypothetical protein